MIDGRGNLFFISLAFFFFGFLLQVGYVLVENLNPEVLFSKSSVEIERERLTLFLREKYKKTTDFKKPVFLGLLK